jgi:hypothetical protein
MFFSKSYVSNYNCPEWFKIVSVRVDDDPFSKEKSCEYFSTYSGSFFFNSRQELRDLQER